MRERQSSRTRTPNQLHQPRRTDRSMRLSPHAFQQQECVRKPILMLRPGRPIVETGSLTDFADQTHFTRLFKQQMGTTPKVYQATFS
ncbi:helix-turn-helix domain-containing protein [Paraburkholderia terrae]